MTKAKRHPCRSGTRRGYTLIELVAVFFIIMLILSIVVPDAISLIRAVRLNEDVARFARTLRTAVETAVLTGRHLEVVIDVRDGYYTVYEKPEDLSPDGTEDFTDQLPVIARQGLNYCYIKTIDLPDGTHQYSGLRILHATPAGWEESVIFDLIDDRDERHRFVRCDEVTARVVVSRRPLFLPEPLENISQVASR